VCDGFEIKTESAVLIQKRTETELIDENREPHSTTKLLPYGNKAQLNDN